MTTTLLVLALTSLGAATLALITRISPETFRRLCASLDAYLVVFGLSYALAASGVAAGVAYQLLVATVILDGRLLWTFFRPEQAAQVVIDDRMELAA